VDGCNPNNQGPGHRHRGRAQPNTPRR
jgi:hypothetical protein